MQEAEYLEKVTAQMRCKKAREPVAWELKQHIEEQAEKYKEFGLDEESAKERAVAQMGDPIQVGTDMDRIHRPDMDKRTFFFICILSIGGSFIYRLLLHTEAGLPSLPVLFWQVFAGSVPGILIMGGIMWCDYTLPGRHPFLIGMGLLLANYIGNAQFGPAAYGKYGSNYLFFAMASILYGAAVYRLGKKRIWGILCSIFWLLFQTICFLLSGISSANTMNFLLIGIIILNIAIGRGWFVENRKKLLAVLWGSISLVLGGLLFYIFIAGEPYMRARLEAYMLFGNNQNDYILNTIRQEIANAGFFHGTGNLTGIGGNENEYLFINLISRYGLVAALFVGLIFIVLFLMLFGGLKKQSNRLGTLMGTAAILVLLVSVAEHILYNLGVIATGALVLPFFSGTGQDASSQGEYCAGAILAYYAALGIYFSIYRFRRVVKEGSPKPVYRIKMKRVE